MRGYLVHYERRRVDAQSAVPTRGIVILQEIHPLAWAAYPPTSYAVDYYRDVTSWQEFDCTNSVWWAVLEGGAESDCLDDMILAAQAAASGHNAEHPSAVLRDALAGYARELRREEGR